MKGEAAPTLSTNIVDVHGNFSSEPFVGVIGGQLMQLYYIFDEIMNKYPKGLQNYMEKKI